MKVAIIAILIIAIVIGIGLALRPAAPQHATPFAQVPVAPGAGPAPIDKRFDKLLGEWKRTDGDYLIDVRRVATNGQAQVGYFNPTPIHVAVATASADDGVLKLFVELQDRGYPGSQYRLALKPDGSLQGTYFQATSKETYPVAFVLAAPRQAPADVQPVIVPATPPPAR